MVILLTACVNPNGMILTKLNNQKLRLNQYKSSIRFYLENTDKQIIVVENTGYDFSNDFTQYISKQRLECLTFNGNNYNKSLGKGYGESLIIDYALKNSQFINKDNAIVKITGRYIVSNIIEILSLIKDESYAYVNISRIKGNFLCDSRLFAAPITFFTNYFFSYQERLNDSNGFYFEHALYHSIKQWVTNKNKFKEFRYPFIFNGVTGSTGKQITNSRTSYIKSFIKYYLHKIGIFENRKK